MNIMGEKAPMISRTGKFTEEINMILKHKEEILYDQPKKIVRSSSMNTIEALVDKVHNFHANGTQKSLYRRRKINS